MQYVDRFAALGLEDVDLTMVTAGDHTAPIFSEHNGFGLSCKRFLSQVGSLNVAGW